MAELQRRAAARAQRERQRELAQMAKDAEAAAKALDGGEGAFRASLAQQMAIRRVRDELAAKAAVAPERLLPSAAAAVTLVPSDVPAFTDGYLMAVDDTLGAVSAGAVRRVQKDRDHLRFASAGTRLALVFRQA